MQIMLQIEIKSIVGFIILLNKFLHSKSICAYACAHAHVCVYVYTYTYI